MKIDASGKLIQPRWKYFSAMMFLDRLSNGGHSYSGASTAVYDEINDTTSLTHQDSFLGKRNAEGELTAVTCGRQFIDGRSRIRKTLVSTSNAVDPEAAESTILTTEDEYSAFCKFLFVTFIFVEIFRFNGLPKL